MQHLLQSGPDLYTNSRQQPITAQHKTNQLLSLGCSREDCAATKVATPEKSSNMGHAKLVHSLSSTTHDRHTVARHHKITHITEAQDSDTRQ
jgi:hypothetical protein